MAELIEIGEQQERVILFAASTNASDDTEESVEELRELVKTAGAETVGVVIQNRENIHPGTYLGKGKIQELKEMVWESGATGVVCDDELSPAQLKNLEDALDTKVMDRTMIILDIFAARAKTREGKIQVELAQLRYRAVRLVGLRNSLSRLGGGIGTRGPGETKLEVDRRRIHERISQLKSELQDVERHRDVVRKQREQSGTLTAAIVGYTNAGKSTLLKLLMRFWDVQQGSVTLSGTMVADINTANLRNMESFVTQETHLFHDSIKNNLRIAKLTATDEEIEAACKKASVHDFILTLPQGYDTPVGELGDTLSGGERQRLGLARAFLHDAPFLLLDEPTSNLDSLNEAVILKSLREKREGKTVVLVSHRRSTMRIADRVYSVEHGRMS